MFSKYGALAAAVTVGLALAAATTIGAHAVAAGQARLGHQMMGGHSASPTASARQWHRFRGSVRYADRAHHWFSMRTAMRQYVRIYTNHHTYWDGCDWGDMYHMGYRVDVRAYRSHSRWMAAQMRSWDNWMMP